MNDRRPEHGLTVAAAVPAPGPGGVTGTARHRPDGPSVDQLEAGVLRGDRALLGRAISLVESTNPKHEAQAGELLHRILPRTGGAIRVGITGVPGAGKSTFIERLGTSLTAAGRRVAVLAVDPSSGVSGGSILGDKVRMPKLATDPGAFIRPSPAGAELGGVARRTRETLRLCEAAGFDVVLVETVGVGQSETAVAGMTDVFVALMITGAGDELQGIKRGLLELVDVVLVNKADGDNAERARAAARQYAAAIRLTGRRDDGHEVPVLTCSGISGAGIEDGWRAVESIAAWRRASGALAERRRQQELSWMRALIDEGLRRTLLGTPAARRALAQAEADVLAGRVGGPAAAAAVLASLMPGQASVEPN